MLPAGLCLCLLEGTLPKHALHAGTMSARQVNLMKLLQCCAACLTTTKGCNLGVRDRGGVIGIQLICLLPLLRSRPAPGCAIVPQTSTDVAAAPAAP